MMSCGQARPQAVATGLPVNIGDASRLTGISTKMIRHYEGLGLLPPIHRTTGGYRQYTDQDIHTLKFIRRSRDLGFSMSEITDLLSLWNDQQRSSAQVRDIANRHVEELQQRIASLVAMKQTLEQLISSCQGNHRPECPILDDLSGSCCIKNHQ